MPPVSRKRRVVVDEAEEDGSEEELEPSTQRRRGRRAPVSDESSEEEAENGDVEEEVGEEMDMDVGDGNSQDQVVKKFVRYALACEYSRQPIARVGIREKVLLKRRGTFNRVFDAAQKQLRTKFGVEMVELPLKEKVTLKERRAAQKSSGNAKQTQSYILRSILPPEYRTPTIMPPSVVPSSSTEGSYVGFYTVIISLIQLNGGTLAEPKLDRYLKRMNADVNMPMEKTEVVLQKMIKQGYLIKIKDRVGDEEITEWMVGSRGRVEVGNRGIQGLVSEVYGDTAPDDLRKRMHRSLGMEVPDTRDREEP